MTFHPALRLIVPFALAALAGCGPATTTGGTTGAPATPTPARTPAPDARGWSVTATQDQATPSHLTVVVTVRGPLRVENGCGVAYPVNLWLTDASGREVTAPRVQNWACVAPPPGGYVPTLVPAGQTREFGGMITLLSTGYARLAPGTYLIAGQVSVDPAGGVSGAVPPTPVTIR